LCLSLLATAVPAQWKRGRHGGSPVEVRAVPTARSLPSEHIPAGAPALRAGHAQRYHAQDELYSTSEIGTLAVPRNFLDMMGLSRLTAMVSSHYRSDKTTVGAVAADAATPALSIADVSLAESRDFWERPKLTFSVTLSAPSAGDVSFNVTASDGTAIKGSDYYFPPPSRPVTFTIPAGQLGGSFSNQDINVAPDSQFELDETFTLALGDPVNAVIGDGVAVVTILDEDPRPTISVRDAFVTERNVPVWIGVVIELSNRTYQTVTLNYTTVDGTARVLHDYGAESGSITLFPGALAHTLIVPIATDVVPEATKSFSVVINGATNAMIRDPEGVVTIADDDLPFISFLSSDDTWTYEGKGAATFNIGRRGVLDGTVTADFKLSDGTATGGVDYVDRTQTLVFLPNEREKRITIPSINDALAEGSETLYVSLINPTGGAVIEPGSIRGVRIIDDDDSCTYTLTRPALPAFPVIEMPWGGFGPPVFVSQMIGGVTVESREGCAWTAISNSSFIRMRDPGSAIAWFEVAPNPNAESRTGTMTVAGQTFTIRQDGTDSGSTFEIRSPAYQAREDAGSAFVQVLRRGDTTGAASVKFETADDPAAVPCDPTATQPDGTPYTRGAAYARCDYATTVETLTWPAGDSKPKTITIPLINDSHAERAESLQVRLSDPQGGELGGVRSATLTVVDDETTAAEPNPISGHAFFVRQHYLDFLSREPEAGEPWTNILDNCPDAFNTQRDSPSALCDRVNVSSSFFLAPEFHLKGFYAYLFYRAGLDRRPEYSEIVLDMREVTGQTPGEVFRKRAGLAAAFVQRAEFKAVYDGLSNAGYVDALLGRYNAQQITTEDPQQPEGTAQVTLTRQALTEALNSNNLTRAQVLRALVQSDESARDEFNGAFVAMQYYGYLRRTPEPAGYNAWLEVLRRGDTRTMVNGFMNSTEYKLRFGGL
jgi:hypothetical protein